MLLFVSAAILLAGCQAANTPSATPTSSSPSSINATVAPLGTLFPTTSTPQPTEAPIVLQGAKTTASGLQFLEEVAGTGIAPKTGDIITMNFKASLADGTELVNTYTDGKPSSTIFGRNKLLPGWEEAIGLMKVGGKAKIVLTPALAFGDQGSGSIPPNAQIVMEVELLSSVPAPIPPVIASDQYTTTASGLQFVDLKIGSGAVVTKTNVVATNYTIWVKGDPENLYITSSLSKSPITFTVGTGSVVFPGWEEGVTGMKLGGKRLLIVPPNLALGDQGGGDIPPKATLIMEIDLVSNQEARKPAKVEDKDFTTTASGLKYYDLVVGTGATPQNGQTVVVHYTGWLLDGTQFDSSVDRGQPFSFTLGSGSVIQGWDEGVLTMKVGGKRQLVVPPSLAYGSSGSGGVIPANATLVFEVELLEITK